MSKDNGDPRPKYKAGEFEDGKLVKTPEELKAERLKRYQDDPDKFIELDEIVMMTIFNAKSPTGMAMFVNPNAKRSVLNNSQAELTREIDKRILQMQIAGEMMNAGSKILKPGDKIPFYKRIGKK